MMSNTPARASLVPTSLPPVLLRPLFIVGAPRSGTTWVQRLLTAHPRIVGGTESHLFNALSALVPGNEERRNQRRLVGLRCYFTESRRIEIMTALWQEAMTPLLSEKPAATVLIEKTPDHAHHMQRILRVLPAARFVHVLRDSRAVIASLLDASRQPWGKDWAPRTLDAAADKWLRCVREARHVGRLLPSSQYMEIRYEDIHREGVSACRKLYAFAEVEADDDMIAATLEAQSFERQKQVGGSPLFAGTAREKTQRSTFEPTGFFNEGRPDGWRRKLSYLQRRRAWALTGKLMRELGYAR